MRHVSNKLGYDMTVDCTIITPIDSYASDASHTLAVVVFMCAEKKWKRRKGYELKVSSFMF